MLQFSPNVIQIIAACFVHHKFVILNRFLCWLQIKTSFVSSYQQPYILCLYSLKLLHLLTLERCKQLIYIMVQPCVTIQRLITRVIHAFIHVFQHVEEILGYLQVCVKVEATKTLLCVQQVLINMLHHIFSYMSGQVFSSWRFRLSKSLPLLGRPHHDEFAPSIITSSPAPFLVCSQNYNSFPLSGTCSFIRREK